MKTKIALALGIALLQSVTMTAGGKGKFPAGEHPAAAPKSADAQQAKSGPLSYAIAPTPDYSAHQLGVLDIGLGKFYPIATTATIAFGIAKNARSRLYFVDANSDLYQINPGNGKVAKVGATGIVGAIGLASTADGTV